MAQRTYNSIETLQNLLNDVADREARSEDFIADTRNIQFQTVDTDRGNQSNLILEREGGAPTKLLRLNDVAFDQVAERTQIPVRTARRFRDEYPEVLDHAVRSIFDKEPETRMIRSFADSSVSSSGVARAFVSDRFKTFDNHHLLAAALPQLLDNDNPAQWELVTGTVTDKRLYVQLKSKVIVAEPKIGDVMAHGIRLVNSEVGHGSIAVEQMAFTLWCLNGCTTGKVHRKAHLGSRHTVDADFASILSSETIEASNEALKLQFRDVIASYSSRESFDEAIERFSVAHGRFIESSPQEAVESLTKVLQVPKSSEENIMAGLMETLQQPGYNTGSGISQATLANAVTAVQHMVPADDAGEWQQLGAKVIDLSESQWEQVAKAA